MYVWEWYGSSLRRAIVRGRKRVAKKVFVGGLAWATRDEGLREAFEQFGPVSDAKVITDRDTGRSRGFGFVTIEDDAGAEEAIAQMDGANLDGRSIRVNEARERAPRRGGFADRTHPRCRGRSCP